MIDGLGEIMAEKFTFIPKGGMCISCKHKNDLQFCKDLNFEAMPKMSKSDTEGYVLVKCVEFERV